MALKKVFISLPMNGKSDEEIENDLRQAEKAYISKNGSKEVLFCHNHQTDEIPVFVAKKEYESVWYLGRALQAMSKCDEVLFYGNWRAARGCVMEHAVCDRYHIPFTEIEKEEKQP